MGDECRAEIVRYNLQRTETLLQKLGQDKEMPIVTDKCPICHNAEGGVYRHLPNANLRIFSCRCSMCGDYDADSQAYNWLAAFKNDEGEPQTLREFTKYERALIAHRLYKERKIGSLSLITTDWLEQVVSDDSLPTPGEQAAAIVEFIADQVSQSGQSLSMLPDNLHVVIGAPSREAAVRLVEELEENGTLRFNPSGAAGYTGISPRSLDFPTNINLSLDEWKKHEARKCGRVGQTRESHREHLEESNLGISRLDMPVWVDKEISASLPTLREQGEGPHLEFKSEYPENGYKLSHEIAAFASSGGGKILVGISDEGELIGLSGFEQGINRDKILRQVQGLCVSNIRPAIRVDVKFAKESSFIVLAIIVPSGPQPVYYSGGKPYIRHLSSSRPAEPNEVAEKISSSTSASSSELSTSEPKSEILFTVAAHIIEIMILCDQVHNRQMNPWLDHMNATAEGIAREFRAIVVKTTIVDVGLDNPLREISSCLDRVISHCHTLDNESWQEYVGYWQTTCTSAREVMQQHIGSVLLLENQQEKARNQIFEKVQQLVDLDRRAESMVENSRVQELMDDAGMIGRELLRLSYWYIAAAADSFAENLRQSAKQINLLETTIIYLDGGRSTQNLLSRLHDCTEQIQSLMFSFIETPEEKF